MKTINYKYWILLFAFVWICQSCVEDFVEVEIPSTITTQNFPRTAGDLRAILTGLYDELRDEYNNSIFGEERGDAFDVGIIGTVSDSWAQNLNGGNGPQWFGYYRIINNINIIITTSDTIEFPSDSEKRQILGEAYFLRALTYFQMIKIWGDVPLLLNPVDQNSEAIARTVVGQVIEQVFADIDNAITNLPGGFDSKYTASVPAAYALMADARMWSGKVLGGGASDFQAAIAAIDDIAGVSLLTNFADVFDTKANDEVIFSIFFDFNEQHNMYGRRLAARDLNVDPILNPDVPSSVSFNARHDYRPSDIILNLFNDPADVRAARTFIPILTVDGDDPDTEPDILTTSQNKFRGTENNNDRFFDDDIIVYRWADMLLLRAEANAALNQIPEAVADLDLVRGRAGLAPYSGATDQASVEQEILDERGRELFLELKRYWDLVRFDAGGTIDIYAQVPNLSGSTIPLLWPINDNVIAENDLITQTPGY